MALAVTNVSLGFNYYDDPLRPTSTGVTITGTDLGATESNTEIWLTNNPTWGSETVKTQQASPSGWSDASLTGWSVSLGSLPEGENIYLVIVKDPGGTPVASTGVQLLISVEDVHFEFSASFALPTGTGSKTVYTPTKSGFGGTASLHPVRSYQIFWCGNTADDTVQQRVNFGRAWVIKSDGYEHEYGWSGAGTDGDTEEARAMHYDDSETASFFDDASSADPGTDGAWSIGDDGELLCNFSANADSGQRIRVIALAGRTAKARIYTAGVTDGSITGIDLPSNPALTAVGGTGDVVGGNGVVGLWAEGYWDGKSTSTCWWSAPCWNTLAKANAIVQGEGGWFGQYDGNANTYEMTAPAYSADGDNIQLGWTGGSSGDEVGVLMWWTDGLDSDSGIVTKETSGSDDTAQVIKGSLSYDPAIACVCTAMKLDQAPGIGDGTSARYHIGFASADDLDQGAMSSTMVNTGGSFACDSITTSVDRCLVAYDDVSAAVDYEAECTSLDAEFEVTWRTANTEAAYIGYWLLEATQGANGAQFLAPAI